MDFQEHETVQIKCDKLDRDIHKGDLGAIVAIYQPGVYEVEFVNPDGTTKAFLTLKGKFLKRANVVELAHAD